MTDIRQRSDPGLADSSLSEILADAELCEEIEKWSAPIFIKTGEILFRQGDEPLYAFLVKTGELALTMHVSGDAVWNVCAKRGSLVGLPAIVGNEAYSMEAKASQDSRICQISRDDFHRVTQQNPHLCCNVLQILAAEVQSARQALSGRLIVPK